MPKKVELHQLIAFRINEQEYNILIDEVKKSGQTISGYIRNLIIEDQKKKNTLQVLSKK